MMPMPRTSLMSPPAGGQETTKKRLLELLRRDRGLTAQQLAESLEISVPAARRHLSDLQEQDLIQMQQERPMGRGRPQQVFLLTERGESMFPKTYSKLCVEIFGHIEQLYGTKALLKILDARTNDLVTNLSPKIASHLPLGQQLEHLVVELNKMGFDALLEQGQEGGQEVYYISHRNCPNLTVARQYQELCMTELNLYIQILGVPVSRESRIVCGQGVCRYRIEAVKTTTGADAHE